MLKSLVRPAVAAAALCLSNGLLAEDAAVVNLYNWNDYFAEDTLQSFEDSTGIKPVLDLYDSNEVLEAKLLAGHSGYDVVFPTARPFAARQAKAGIYRELDRNLLPNWKNLDATLLASLDDIDPGNRYLVPYMWGTTGLGVNAAKVRAALGEDAVLDSWSLVFDPAKASKLAACGISLLDDPTEVLGAALNYLGRDPKSTDKADLEAIREMIEKVRPYIRNFHSSQYISGLANGDLCVAHGWSGDILQARDRAAEAANGIEVTYVIPREGAVQWMDLMAIPADAPHVANAHAFINFILDPKAAAAISNYTNYANGNTAATELLDEGVRTDPGIYPSDEVKAKLFALATHDDKGLRKLNRVWTRIKANR